VTPQNRFQQAEIVLIGVIDPPEIGFKKPIPLSVSITSQTCKDLRNGYSSELLSLW
jgi:hypothetical protein